MADGVRVQLASRLGVPAERLAVLDQFADRDVDRLVAVVTAAITTQSRELDAALERALGFVPALLRKRARKLLFGERRGG